MPNIDLSDDEYAAVVAQSDIDEDKYPMSPRLGPLKAALAKLDCRAEADHQTSAAAGSADA